MRAILTYHSIDSSGSPISVDRATFARHVAWLASGATRVVDVGELLGLRDDDDAIAITFDDGFVNLRDEAWPLLRDHGIPATVFVVSDLAGGVNEWEDVPGSSMPVLPLLGLDDLAALASEGLGLGVHSRTHPRLPGLDASRLRDEVAGAKERILGATGSEVSGFAYPYGAFDGPSVEMARAHFPWACTADLGWLSGGDDPHMLPRLDAYYLQTPGRLESWGRPAFARYMRLRAFARGVRARVSGWIGR